MNTKLLLAVLSLLSLLPAAAATWIAAAEQAGRRWVIFDAESEAGYAWEWKPEQDARIRPEHYGRFNNPSEVMPTDCGKLLVACSGRAFAQLDVVTGKADFYGVVEAANPHSIAVLPDGAVAVASSHGNGITVMDVRGREFDPSAQRRLSFAPLRHAHTIAWDGPRNCLWGVGLHHLAQFGWDGRSLTEKASWNFTEKGCGAGGHDLMLEPSGTILFSTRERLSRFDPAAQAFAVVEERKDVKSYSALDGKTLVTFPQEQWWTDTVELDGRPVRRAGARFYKSRLYPTHMLPWLKVTEPVLRDARFAVTDFGARPDGTLCTAAFEAAMAAAADAGGGRVVVPAGTWLTGKIHFRSGCALHLEEGAVLEFSDDPADYLPSVPTSWEGVECYNYSPLIYGCGVTNVAITGRGLIRPRMGRWRKWFGRPPEHRRATELLYHWCSTNAPVAKRDVTKLAGANMRPHLIQFNRCRNVLLDGFSIKESPFWTIHLYLSENCIVRNLESDCHGHNNDGVDIEMTRNVLVEACTFNQGDDGIVLKAGRNQDAWRLATPTENVVVRDCDFLFAHTLLGVGSELSGGVRNVWMHDCRIGDCLNMFFIKTNRRRGGFVENVCGERLKAGKVKWAGVGVETDVLYQWAVFPDYELRRTDIRNIMLKDASCTEAGWAVRLRGDAQKPPENIRVEGLSVGRVKHADVVDNCRDVSVRFR